MPTFRNLFQVHVWDDDRLAGAGLIAPVINYWWPSFPANLSRDAYYLQPVQDQWALRVSHYLPWLVYWWNTQKLFPASGVIANKPDMFSPQDLEIVKNIFSVADPKRELYRVLTTI